MSVEFTIWIKSWIKAGLKVKLYLVKSWMRRFGLSQIGIKDVTYNRHKELFGSSWLQFWLEAREVRLRGCRHRRVYRRTSTGRR